jgi:Domain of unkown function (DUF1775)
VRVTARMAAIGAVVGCAVLGAAGPALAHVEVSSDKKTAGAEDVTLTFTGEAERSGAGIESERVVLPAGIAPASVTPVKLPAGWKFTATADGFTVGGKALKPGVDATWRVRIGKLPDGETRLSFKTLETYANGDVERWIEIQEPGQDEPDQPAPLLRLRSGPAAAPAAASSAPAEPSSAAPAPSAPAVASGTAPVAEPAVQESGSRWWIWVLAAAVVIAAGVAVMARRRRP